jgi:hypothetical protein
MIICSEVVDGIIVTVSGTQLRFIFITYIILYVFIYTIFFVSKRVQYIVHWQIYYIEKQMKPSNMLLSLLFLISSPCMVYFGSVHITFLRVTDRSINIDYYMAFFISYPLSARGHDISPRADKVKGSLYERGLIKGMIWTMTCYDMFIIFFNRGNNWFVLKCLL